MMENNQQIIAEELGMLGADSLLLNLRCKNPFDVPAGYFESFAGSMLNLVECQHITTARQELQEISPLLASMKKTNAFTVPEGYFSAFLVDPATLKTQVQDNAGPKVIRMNPNRSRNIFRYAVAATIAFVITISMFFLWNNRNDVVDANNNFAYSLPELPDEVLESYLAGSPVVYSSELIDSADTAFLDRALLQSEEDFDIETMLGGVPDGDLNAYVSYLL